MTRTAAQDALEKCVNWKIFEIQSSLISEDSTEEDINQGKLWLQLRHYSEVVEERANDNRCGYPLCNKHLDKTLTQRFRISYQDKAVYKIENSCYFCSDPCVLKSFAVQTSLDDSAIYTRDIVKTLDFSRPVKSSISDLLVVLGGDKTQDSNSLGLPICDQNTPTFRNSALGDGGEVISSHVPFASGEVIPPRSQSIVAPAVSQSSRAEGRELLTKLQLSENAEATTSNHSSGNKLANSALTTPQYVPKAVKKQRVIPRSTISVDKQSTTALSGNNDNNEIDLAVIFEQMKTARSNGGLGAAGGVAMIPGNEPATSSASTTRAGQQIVWSDPAVAHNGVRGASDHLSEASLSAVKEVEVSKKSVKWSGVDDTLSSAGSKGAVQSSRAQSQSKSLQQRQQLTGASSSRIMSGRVGEVVERTAPRPMSQGAMMLKQEGVTTSVALPSASLQEASDRQLDKSTSQSEVGPDVGAGGAFDIEGYVAELKQLRVAPVTAVKNLSYDPFAHWGAVGDDNHLPASVTAGDGDLVVPIDDDEWGDEEEDEEEQRSGDMGGVSLFLSIWQTLDDLFGFALITLREQQQHPPLRPDSSSSSSGAGQEGGVEEERMPVATECQQVQQAIVTMMDRGLRSAERLLNVAQVLQSRSLQTTYATNKNRILSHISRQLGQCPSLQSAGWTLIGILVVDAIVARKCLLQSADWEARVEAIAAGVLGGGHKAGSQLRMGDLKILRSFFDQL